MTTKESLLKSLRDLPVLTKDTLAIAAATNLLFKIYFIYYEYSSYIKELKTFFKVQWMKQLALCVTCSDYKCLANSHLGARSEEFQR